MPVIIDNTSGDAVNLPDDQSAAALQAGTHSVPMLDPEGNPVDVPYSEASAALASGHTQPSPEQLHSYLNQAKYGSTLEQAKTFAEGVGEGATFGLSPYVESALFGTKAAAQRAREEINPGVKAGGKVTGLAGSALIPGVGEAEAVSEAVAAAKAAGGGAKEIAAAVKLAKASVPQLGEAGILGQAGRAAQKMTGLGGEGAGLISRAGAAAVRQASEMFLFGGADEVAKAAMQDPNQSMESIVSNIGMSSLVGAVGGLAFEGAGKPLWNATVGKKLETFLGAVKNKVQNEAGASAIGQIADQAGLELTPDVKAGWSGAPEATKAAQDLRGSQTYAGGKFTANEDAARAQLGDAVLDTVSRTKGSLDAPMSDNALGGEIQNKIVSKLKSDAEPVSAEWDALRDRFKNEKLPDIPNGDGLTSTSTADRLKSQLAEKALEQRFDISADSDTGKAFRKVLDEVGKANTLDDLRQIQSSVYNMISDPTQSRLRGMVFGTLRDEEGSILERTLGQKAPELMDKLSELRKATINTHDILETLNDRLHLGKYNGVKGFTEALSEMRPETVLNRLKGSKDADIIRLLGEKFPEAAQVIKDFQLAGPLAKAAAKAEDGIHAPTFFRELNKMSPEMRDFILSPKQQARLGAIEKLVNSIPDSPNPSGTGNRLDGLMKYMSGGVGAVMSLATGHNPILGFMKGQMANAVGREIPDFGKFAMLKFLGSEEAPSALGFKAMYNASGHMYEAAQTTNKAVSSIFKAGSEVLPASALPTEKSLNSLDKGIKAAQANPEQVMGATGNLGKYMPEHAMAAGTMIGRAAAYLSTVRPDTSPLGPFDPPRTPSSAEVAKYNRALQIVEQPLMTLKLIKDGSLTGADISAISSVYPSLYQHLQQKLQDQMTELHTKGVIMPYRVRLAAGLFLGSPVDASTMPQNMLINQQAGSPPPDPQAPNGGPSRGSKQAFKHTSQLAMSGPQSREQDRQGR